MTSASLSTFEKLRGYSFEQRWKDNNKVNSNKCNKARPLNNNLLWLIELPTSQSTIFSITNELKLNRS